MSFIPGYTSFNEIEKMQPATRYNGEARVRQTACMHCHRAYRSIGAATDARCCFTCGVKLVALHLAAGEGSLINTPLVSKAARVRGQEFHPAKRWLARNRVGKLRVFRDYQAFLEFKNA